MDEHFVNIARYCRKADTVSEQKLQIAFQLDPTRAHSIMEELDRRGMLIVDTNAIYPNITEKDIVKLQKEYDKQRKKELKAEQKHAKRM